VPDSAALRDLIGRHQRRLYSFLRILVPSQKDIQAVFSETVQRLCDKHSDVPPERFADLAEGIGRQVAAEKRGVTGPAAFSDDLYRQLAESAGPWLDLMDKRGTALANVLDQLPPPERDLLRRKHELGMTIEQIALAENRSASVVSRDLFALNATLVSALRSALADPGPEPPGGAAELGRLTDQILDGTISDDGRLVLETLLLGDGAAQAHYHRHIALAAELTLRFRGAPPMAELRTDHDRRSRIPMRERAVTVAFVVACLAVAGFAVWAVLRILR